MEDPSGTDFDDQGDLGPEEEDEFPQAPPEQPAPEESLIREVRDPLPQFDERHAQAFEGLLYLGALDRPFTFMGHAFVIRTLTTADLLEIGLIHRDYKGTFGDVKAYQAAVAAACIVTVDGTPLPQPLTNRPEDTPLRNRFNYVISHWYPQVLDKVYEQSLILEVEVQQVLTAMGKASG